MTIVRRAEWGFRGPLGNPLSLPSRGAWLHHSVTSPTSDPHRDMRQLEQIGRSRFGLLSYQYAVHHPSGTILEGQGDRQGPHLRGQNHLSHGIVVIGNFETQAPSPEVVESVAWLVRHGHRAGWWQSPTLLGGHRDAPGASTACPGRHLHARIGQINQRATHDTEEVFLMALSEQQQREIHTWVGQARLMLEQTRDATGRLERAARELLVAEVARIRADTGRDPDAGSDLIWAGRILAGTHDLAEVRRRLAG